MIILLSLYAALGLVAAILVRRFFATENNKGDFTICLFSVLAWPILAFGAACYFFEDLAKDDPP